MAAFRHALAGLAFMGATSSMVSAQEASPAQETPQQETAKPCDDVKNYFARVACRFGIGPSSKEARVEPDEDVKAAAPPDDDVARRAIQRPQRAPIDGGMIGPGVPVDENGNPLPPEKLEEYLRNRGDQDDVIFRDDDIHYDSLRSRSPPPPADPSP